MDEFDGLDRRNRASGEATQDMIISVMDAVGVIIENTADWSSKKRTVIEILIFSLVQE